ncbi:Inhibitor of nuclear factor kappa-B kinase subunit alpha [Lamellibrachia satsuma]|nr:Inhibitor of nuclear factor kappa-B kinase subunit alpha [Lamellibrachia satsuma]
MHCHCTGCQCPTSAHRIALVCSNTMTKETRGCWQKERTLGHGGFGEVTLWNNMETGKYIAIKTLQRRKDGDDRVLERWQTEVEILLRLDHNNVVKGFEVPAELQECDKSSMAMQYCSGGDLRQLHPKSGMNFPSP